MRLSHRRAALAWLVGLALPWTGCQLWQQTRRDFSPRPIIEERAYASPAGLLAQVGVMPFYPRPGKASADAAAQVATYVTEALRSAGIGVIAPSDLEVAFTAQGRPTPRLDAKAAAALAAHDFGATAVLLGEVLRYRDREGGSLASGRAASVSYEVTLYEAPSARRLWSGRFDETQRPLGENVLESRRYPGGGTRWLTAAELTRWGAEHTARALLAAAR